MLEKKEVNNSLAHQKISNFLLKFWGVDGPESVEGELQNIWRTKRACRCKYCIL